MENNKLRPVVQPAALRNTTSFLVDQGQIPRQSAATKSSLVKPAASKVVTLAIASQWADTLEKVSLKFISIFRAIIHGLIR